jgi:hypothetical protein
MTVKPKGSQRLPRVVVATELQIVGIYGTRNALEIHRLIRPLQDSRLDRRRMGWR